MLRGLIKDSIIYGGSDVTTKVFAFIAFPLIAAALSPAIFGLLELITTVAAMIGLFVGCGLNNAVQRFYWDSSTPIDERPVLVSSGLLLQVFIGLSALIAGAFVIPALAEWISTAGYQVSWIGLGAGLLLAVVTQWSQYILDVTRLHFAPWKYFFLAVTSKALSVSLAVIAVVYLAWGIDGYLGVQALAILLVLPLAMLMIRRDLTPKLSKKWRNELVAYGYPFIFVGIAYWLFGSIDRWMLASMVTIEEVGIYSVAFRFASIALLISTAFGLAWSPYAIKVKTDYPEQYREFYVLVLLILLAVMLVACGSIALFSREILNLIMPEEYQGAAVPLSILVIGVIFQSTQQVTAVGISLEKKTYLFARLTWFTATVNFGLNYILIPEFGIDGAAWATTISYLMLTSSYLYFTQRLHPLPIRWGGLGLLFGYGLALVFLSINLPGSLDFTTVLLYKSALLLVGVVAIIFLFRSAKYEFR